MVSTEIDSGLPYNGKYFHRGTIERTLIFFTDKPASDCGEHLVPEALGCLETYEQRRVLDTVSQLRKCGLHTQSQRILFYAHGILIMYNILYTFIIQSRIRGKIQLLSISIATINFICNCLEAVVSELFGLIRSMLIECPIRKES